MKKTGVLLLAILILNIFTIISIHQIQAQEPNIEDPLGIGINPEDIAGKEPEQLKKESEDYLSKERGKILEKYKLGRALLAISSFIEKANPFFKIVLGVEYSLSWAFIFAVVVWGTLFWFIYLASSGMFEKTIPSIIASFAITSLIGLSGVIKKAIDLLSTIINNKWIFWLSLGITLIIAFIIIKLGGGLKKIIEEQREKATKEKTEQHRQIIKTSAEVEKKNLESYGKS